MYQNPIKSCFDIDLIVSKPYQKSRSLSKPYQIGLKHFMNISKPYQIGLKYIKTLSNGT